MNQHFKKYITTFFTLLEWILFFGLLFSSMVFTWQVIEKFNSKATDFGLIKENISLLPVITICFTDTEKNWKYQEDFNITYIILIGENEILKQLDFEAIYTEYKGVCYQLNAEKESEQIEKEWHQILIKSKKYELPTMEFYFTSVNNSYGIIYNDWRNGEVYKVDVNANNLKSISLTVEKHNYLKSESSCNYQSLYECFESKITLADLHNCSDKSKYENICFPTTLPNAIYPICKEVTQDLEYEEYKKCTMEHLWSKIVVNDPGACPRPCTTLQYSGKVFYENLKHFRNGTAAFLEYKFAEPAYVKVYQEYLIFDAIGMIGSVGGTLGMFIGFSFSNVLTILICYLQKFVMYLYSR